MDVQVCMCKKAQMCVYKYKDVSLLRHAYWIPKYTSHHEHSSNIPLRKTTTDNSPHPCDDGHNDDKADNHHIQDAPLWNQKQENQLYSFENICPCVVSPV